MAQLGRLRFFRQAALAVVVAFFLGMLTSGCGSANGSTTPASLPNVSQSTITLIHTLGSSARAVSDEVEDFRVSLFAESGLLVSNPLTVAKQETVYISNVPSTVTSIRVEYLGYDGELLGVYMQAVSIGTYTDCVIQDPGWQKIAEQSFIQDIDVVPGTCSVNKGHLLKFVATASILDEEGNSFLQAITDDATWTAEDDYYLSKKSAGVYLAANEGVTKAICSIYGDSKAIDVTIFKPAVVSVEFSFGSDAVVNLPHTTKAPTGFTPGYYSRWTTQLIVTYEDGTTENVSYKPSSAMSGDEDLVLTVNDEYKDRLSVVSDTFPYPYNSYRVIPSGLGTSGFSVLYVDQLGNRYPRNISLNVVDAELTGFNCEDKLTVPLGDQGNCDVAGYYTSKGDPTNLVNVLSVSNYFSIKSADTSIFSDTFYGRKVGETEVTFTLRSGLDGCYLVDPIDGITPVLDEDGNKQLSKVVPCEVTAAIVSRFYVTSSPAVSSDDIVHINVGDTVTFTAWGEKTDKTVVDISGNVTWLSSKTDCLEAEDEDSPYVFTAKKKGYLTVTANYEGADPVVTRVFVE